MKKSPTLLLGGALLLGLAATPAFADGDATKGERVFKVQCGACHTVEAGKNRVGPSLHGIFGRKTGSVDGFKYSDANKNANITWDEKNMNEYLKDPKAMIKGTTMTYTGLRNEDQREDLIAYLKKAGH